MRFLLVSALAAAASPASAEGVITFLVGEWNTSCASAFAPERIVSSTSWAMGLWSGLNVAEGKTVGRSTDGNGIVGEIELFCRQQPSQTIMAATVQTYRRLEKEGR